MTGNFQDELTHKSDENTLMNKFVYLSSCMFLDRGRKIRTSSIDPHTHRTGAIGTQSFGVYPGIDSSPGDTSAKITVTWWQV